MRIVPPSLPPHHSDPAARDFQSSIPVAQRGMMEKSAVAEHAWENHHPIDWEETTVLDRGRGQELLLKEALHIQMTPSEERFNLSQLSLQEPELPHHNPRCYRV